jgi:hypothetical protein
VSVSEFVFVRASSLTEEGAVMPAATTAQATVRCLYDYVAHSPKELSFAKDEALTVLQQHNR